ncbi:MAG: hypothetical protein AAF492_32275, partial [Verrucomicrobiota bacterium]
MKPSSLVISILLGSIPFIQRAPASSTIFDGVISEVGSEQKKSWIKNKAGERERVYEDLPWIKMRAFYSPYSSVGLQAAQSTMRNGTVKKLEHRRLDEFETFYIDDIPVTEEEIKPLLVKDAR